MSGFAVGSARPYYWGQRSDLFALEDVEAWILAARVVVVCVEVEGAREQGLCGAVCRPYAGVCEKNVSKGEVLVGLQGVISRC